MSKQKILFEKNGFEAYGTHGVPKEDKYTKYIGGDGWWDIYVNRKKKSVYFYLNDYHGPPILMLKMSALEKLLQELKPKKSK